MSTTELTFRSEDGKESRAQAELTRYSHARRLTFALVFGLGGLLLGLATLVPGPHMCVTWIFPFLGAFLAWRAWVKQLELGEVRADCPACDAKQVSFPGGQLLEGHPLKQVCLECRAHLEVRWSEGAPAD